MSRATQAGILLVDPGRRGATGSDRSATRLGGDLPSAKDGIFWNKAEFFVGPPLGSSEAIVDLEKLRHHRATHLVFTWDDSVVAGY